MLLKPVEASTEIFRNVPSALPTEEIGTKTVSTRSSPIPVPAYVTVSETAKTTAEETGAIVSFFDKVGLQIEKSTVPGEIETAYLVTSIADSLPEADKFLRCLRAVITTPEKSFCFSLKGKTENERKKITDLTNIMKMCGVFSECKVLTESIFGKLSKAGNVADFITGRWLEQFCQIATTKIIKEYAEKRGLKWEVFSNVTVHSRDGQQHELDLIFSIGDMVFGTEQKSGNSFSDYDKYRKLGLWLGLVPEHFLLVNSCLENEKAAECIHYFYEYYVCNTANYEQTLMKMINNTMTK